MNPSRFSAWFLRRVTTDAAASAILGDLTEALTLRQSRGPVTYPRLWIERETWRYIAQLSLAAVVGAAVFSRIALNDGWRAVRSSPRTSGMIFGILTLAIATATVTFSVVDAVVLRPLPYDADEELVAVRGLTVGRQQGGIVAAPEFLLWKTRSTTFEAIAATRARGPLQLGGEGNPPPIETLRVTSDLFAVLHAQPYLGRLLTPDDEREDSEAVAVISHALWQQRFSADPAIINRRFGSGDAAVRIVGVMPPDFGFPAHLPVRTDAWAPLIFPAQERDLAAPGLMRAYQVVARLQEGATPESAQTELRTISEDLSRARPEAYQDWRVDVLSLRDSLVGDVKPIMLMALLAVGLVTAIGCVNAANVALTRTTVRSQELALRSALGASRGRLLAGMLAEGLLLSAAASLAALTIGLWAVEAARVSLPEGIALSSKIGLNGRVYVFALIAAVATGLGFIAAPAWHASRASLHGLLKEGAVTITPSRQRWRNVFLATQLALVTVLLISSALVTLSFTRLVGADLGFDRQGMVIVSNHGMNLATSELEALFGGLPGVTAVGVISGGAPPLLATDSASTELTRPGDVGGKGFKAEFRRVSPTYFSAASVPVLRGRTFNADDVASGGAVIVDEQSAREIFGSIDCIGERLRIYGSKTDQFVVGVVANVRLAGPEGASGPQAYAALAKAAGGGVVLRTNADPTLTIAAAKALIARESPAMSAYASVISVDELFGQLTANRRSGTLVMVVFGVLALGIGVAGVYGVVSALVAMQTREFGVRIALGATSTQVAQLVLGRTARTVGIGALLGVPIAAAIGRVSQDALFQTDPLDPRVYGVVLALLIVAACGAALLPALRAARVNPIATLRTD